MAGLSPFTAMNIFVLNSVKTFRENSNAPSKYTTLDFVMIHLIQ